MSKETTGSDENYTDGQPLLYPTISDTEQVSAFSLSESQKLVAWNSGFYSNWMSNVQDSCNLSNIAIPGTHDTATYGIIIPFVEMAAKTQRNECKIKKQLEDGIRFLDLRVGSDDGEKLKLWHSSISCNVSLSEILTDCVEFLKSHPTEAVLVCIKEENHSKGSFGELLKKLIEQTDSYWYRKTEIPKIGDVRGKMVLLRRFGLHSKDFDWGIDLSSWGDGGDGLEISTEPVHTIVQDVYDIKSSEPETRCNEKVSKIITYLTKSRNDRNNFYINCWNICFSESILTWDIKLYASYIQEAILMKNIITPKILSARFRGVQALDYYNHDVVHCIIMTNFTLNMFFTSVSDGTEAYIINTNSSRALDVYHEQTTPETKIIQYDVGLKKNNQIFIFKNVGNEANQNQWKITAKHSELVLDVYHEDKADKTPIIQYPYHGGKNQLWRIIKKDNDPWIIKIQSVNSDKFIDVPEQSTKNEVAIMQWPGNDTCAQEFRLMKTSLIISSEEGDS